MGTVSHAHISPEHPTEHIMHLKTLLFGKRNQVGRRLVFLVFTFSSLITLCTSAIQLATEYHGLRNALNQQLDSVRIYVPSISSSVWDFDELQVQRAIDSLILLPSVDRVSVVTADTHSRWDAGAHHAPATHVIVRSYRLRYKVRGTEQDIGELTVIGSLDGIYLQVERSAMSIILSNALRTFLVALFMLYVIHRLITLRLGKMASKVRELVPDILPLTQMLETDHDPMPETLDELDAVDWTLDRTAKDLHVAVTALATLNEKLEQRVQERTKDLESFSYSVSHDLRTPLRAIAGFSRILDEDYHDKLDPEGQRLLGIVCSNAIRMGQLIDDILAFSRTGSCEMASTSVDMERAVQEVFQDLEGTYVGRDVQLKMNSLPSARGDRVMIRQALENLLANAIKFTRQQTTALIEVSSTVEEGECIYCIKDNGAGFDMQYVKKLFNVFERLHDNRDFEGTGIGLAIVKRVVTRHGGRVWAESQIGEGATFRFTLPNRNHEHE